jgi:NAD(P)-dependent dehydrogenase (short-subunit alcohol dehydrogenase family)
MNTHHPIALITGGSRGLGRSTALKLAAHGSDVIITYRQSRAEAAAVVKVIHDSGRTAAALPLDSGDVKTFDDFATQLAGTLEATFGRDRINYLVNNAGSGADVSFAATTEEQFDELMNVHFKGVFFLTQKLLPQIADGGRIVNISSGLTRFCFPGKAAYAAMKGAVEVLSRYMAKELGARQIAVNVVAPGAIETDFGGGVVRDNPGINKHVASATALGRAGLPDDVGGAIAHLLSPESGWINAQRIEVSGGMNL